ncbi:hypothetical protein OCAR_6883 [Afipia carboxidovorans OM5]|nr:hypothetical protein OCAR_6883 [Afipia carboxidovorans OM5]
MSGNAAAVGLAGHIHHPALSQDIFPNSCVFEELTGDEPWHAVAPTLSGLEKKS